MTEPSSQSRSDVGPTLPKLADKLERLFHDHWKKPGVRGPLEISETMAWRIIKAIRESAPKTPLSERGTWVPCKARLPEYSDCERQRGYVLAWHPYITHVQSVHYSTVRRWHLESDPIEGAHWRLIPEGPAEREEGSR